GVEIARARKDSQHRRGAHALLLDQQALLFIDRQLALLPLGQVRGTALQGQCAGEGCGEGYERFHPVLLQVSTIRTVRDGLARASGGERVDEKPADRNQSAITHRSKSLKHLALALFRDAVHHGARTSIYKSGNTQCNVCLAFSWRCVSV